MPNSIKIDTDGNEDKVLKGACRIFSDNRLRSLVIEMPINKDKERFCRNILAKYGFILDWQQKGYTRNEIWIRR